MAKNNLTITASILIAAVLISGALTFMGTQMCDKDELKAVVVAGVADFVENGPPPAEADERPSMDSTADNNADMDSIMTELSDDDAMIGDPNAPITIVEFSDYQCPYCSKFYNGAYPELKEKYVDTGIAKIIFRDFPLSFHEGAYPAALAAECVREQAGDEGYFKMHDKLFENQSALSGTPQEIAGALATFASGIGVNLEQYNDCVSSDKYKDEISSDIADAAAVGISGTPSFVVNGNVLVGAQPIAAFDQVINEVLGE